MSADFHTHPDVRETLERFGVINPAVQRAVAPAMIAFAAAEQKRRATASEAAILEAARAAMVNVEIARNYVANPVNGTAPYSYVRFHGQRVEFHNSEFDTMQERDAGSAKAAAYAQKINDGLFELAKAAARHALSGTVAPSAQPLQELAGKLCKVRAGELTGIRCQHGWDTSVCPMRGCGDDEDTLIDQLIAALQVQP